MTIISSFKAVSAACAIAVAAMTLPQTGFAADTNDHSHDHEAHTGIYKTRSDTMKALGGAAKSTGAMFKGETEFDLAKVQAAGHLVAAKAATLPSLFPEGTNEGESEALPIIWKDWAGFEAASALLATRAGALASAPDKASAGAAFGAMIKACGGCHETYRLKKD
jgi:cytochrome c556